MVDLTLSARRPSVAKARNENGTMKTTKLILSLLAIALFALPAAAEIIFLKDGRLLHVKVIAGEARWISHYDPDVTGECLPGK